jgi:ABC-type multidrug transport system permease subunit
MFHIIYKDLLQAFTDKKGLLLSFLLPIVLVTLFSLVYGGFQSSVKDKAQEILFCDADSSASSMELLEKLQADNGLKVIQKPIEEAKELVINGHFPSALMVYEGFGDSVQNGGKAPVEFIYDESRSMEMGLTQGALMSTLMPFLGEKGSKKQIHQFINQKYDGDLPEELIKEIHNDIDQQFDGGDSESVFKMDELVTRAISVKADMPWGLIQAFAGTSVMMLLFSIASMGGTLIREQEMGTLKRILYSPIKPWQIIMGKFGSGFVFAMIQMTILLLFSWLVFHLDIFRNFSGLIILTISISLAVSGFGILIASFTKSQKQVESLSLIIILVMSALGGSMMPLFLFPEFLKGIAQFTLNYWAIDGFYDTLGRDVGFGGAVFNAMILVIFAIISSLIAVFVFTKRLKKDY